MGKPSGAYVLSGVVVPAHDQTTPSALVHPYRQGHALSVTTRRAVRGGVGRVDSHIPDTSLPCFVFQYLAESLPSLFGHFLREPLGSEHPRHVQVLHRYTVVGVHQMVGQAEVGLSGSFFFSAPHLGVSGHFVATRKRALLGSRHLALGFLYSGAVHCSGGEALPVGGVDAGVSPPHAPRFSEGCVPLAVPPPRRRARARWQGGGSGRRTALGNTPDLQSPPAFRLVLSGTGRRDHRGCWIGYLYRTPPVTWLEPRKPGSFSFFAPAVKGGSGPVKAADHASAYLDRQPVPLRNVLADPVNWRIRSYLDWFRSEGNNSVWGSWCSFHQAYVPFHDSRQALYISAHSPKISVSLRCWEGATLFAR